MKLSISTSCYINYPLGEVMKRVSRMGYEGIDISAVVGLCETTPKYCSKERRSKIKEMASSFNLEIPSYDCELTTLRGFNIASEHERIRRDTIAYIKESIEFAADIGARVLIVVAGRAPWNVSMEKAWRNAVEGLRECLDSAEENKIILGLEHLTWLEGNVVVNLNDLLKMLKEVESKYIGVVLDTGHVNVTRESLTDYVYALRDHLVHIHVDDNTGLSDDHMPPGMGTINFERFIAALKDINYNKFLSIEPGFNYSTDPDSAASFGLNYIRRILSQR